MKSLYNYNFIKKLLLAMLVVLFVTPAFFVQAQTFVNTGNNPGNPNAPGYNPPIVPTIGVNTGNNPGNPNAPGYSAAAPIVSEGSEDSHAPIDSGYANSIGGRFTLLIYGIFVSIGGLFAWFGGLALDYAIYEFVILMGEKLNGNFGVGLESVWTVIRDLFNLIFIFALIWIGLRTILNSDDSAVQKQLGYLIIAALLINFSLLASKTVVDFTNIAAYQIYSAITVTGAAGSTSPFGAIYSSFTGEGLKEDVAKGRGDYQVTSISGAFMQQFNLATYASPGDGNGNLMSAITASGASGISWKLIGFGILIMFMMMLAGFVFLSGAYLILRRFVALIIYMMLSPAMFLGLIYPSFDKYAKKWRDEFLANAFVAPVYLFLIYVALRMIEGMTDGGSNMNFGNAYQSSGTGDAFAVFVYFFVMCGFLIAASRAAQHMGAAGAEMTSKIGNAGVGFVYRNTAGRAAGGVLKGMDWADRTMARGQDKAGSMSKLNPLRYAAKGGLYLGREVAGGSTTRPAVEGARNYGVLGSRGRKTVEDDMTAQNKRADENNKKASIARDLKSDDEALRKSALEKLSTSEIDAMAKEQSGKQLLLKSAHLLKDNQMKKLEDEHPEFATEIKKKKNDTFFEQFNANPVTFFVGKKPVDIAKLESKILTDPRAAGNLNQKILHHIFADSPMSDSDRSLIKRHLNIVTTGGVSMPGVKPAGMDTATYNLIVTYLNTNEGRLF